MSSSLYWLLYRIVLYLITQSRTKVLLSSNPNSASTSTGHGMAPALPDTLIALTHSLCLLHCSCSSHNAIAMQCSPFDYAPCTAACPFHIYPVRYLQYSTSTRAYHIRECKYKYKYKSGRLGTGYSIDLPALVDLICFANDMEKNI